MKDIVKIETARNLKRKGFPQNGSTEYFYVLASLYINTNVNFIKGELTKKYYPGITLCAPTLMQVILWINNSEDIKIKCNIEEDSIYIYSKKDNRLLCEEHITGKYDIDDVINTLLEFI